jgi:hypothetical protein
LLADFNDSSFAVAAIERLNLIVDCAIARFATSGDESGGVHGVRRQGQAAHAFPELVDHRRHLHGMAVSGGYPRTEIATAAPVLVERAASLSANGFRAIR